VLPGEHWQLAVRLKRPRGLVNPGGRDIERWLFVHGIAATGYVLSSADNRRSGPPGAAGLNGMRQWLSAAIAEHLPARPAGAIVAALAVGDRSRMSRAQWQALRATGTSHLVAISGLHIGLVAGLVYFLVVRLWSLAAAPALWLAAPQAAAVAALLAGFAYAGLAGFSLPTQRALVMLSVAMAALVLRRRVTPSSGLCLALAGVLLWEPFAVVSAGFWLSFGAVAAILLGTSGRIRSGAVSRWRWLWCKWGQVQWLVAVGLLPVTLAWFFAYPLVAPLANMLAVPWAGCVLVPLVLAASVMLLLVPPLGVALLQAAAWAVDALWWLVQGLAGLDWVLRPVAAPTGFGVVAACVGAVLLIAPRALPGRVLGGLWMLPLLLAPVARPQTGAYWLTLLDVGQGLAAVVRTRSHVLIYDTGPRYTAGFDAGRDVIVPYLRHRGIGHADLLIVSHGHNDHVGGARALLDAVPVTAISSNVDADWPGRHACRAGTHWSWDGVEFRILHPASDTAGDGNNSSCVLKVIGRGGRLLLPGDVEAAGEAALLERVPASLRAEVLVVPHHGGRSSSGDAFLDAVQPGMALVPVGYRNRYGFPHRQVLRRLSARGVRVFDTAQHGAISLRLDGEHGIQGPRLERSSDAHIWRAHN
jgi:competence protein ComEC